MQPPKNEGDESDEGDGRSVKRLRTENNAFSHPSTESTRPSLFSSTVSGPSSTHGGAPLFGAAPGKPVSTSPAPYIWRFSKSDAAFASPSQSNNTPGVSQNTGNIFAAGARSTPGVSQNTGSIFGPGARWSSTSGSSVPVGLVQQGTQQSARSPPVKSEGVTTKKEDWLAATVADAKPVVKMPPAPQKVEVFHVHGDLTLVAGEQGIRFRASSQALVLVSSAWERKINGPFSEKSSQHGADGWVMPLPEDNPDALRIALRVIHYKFDAVPTSLSLDTVFHLTVLCDKYDMVGLLKPFWLGWISKLPQPALEPRLLVQQVWVAHKLGHMQLYERTVKEGLSSVTKRTVSGTTGLYLESHPDFNLSKDPHLLALGLLEFWELGRLELISKVKSKLDAALSKLSDPKNTACKYAYPDWQKTCDCAMLGGVHRALHGKPWYSSGSINWENQVTISVRQLVNKLEAVRTEAIGESRMRKKQGSAHKTCTPWERFELADIVEPYSLGTIVALNQSTFEAQAKKIRPYGFCLSHITTSEAERIWCCIRFFAEPENKRARINQSGRNRRRMPDQHHSRI